MTGARRQQKAGICGPIGAAALVALVVVLGGGRLPADAATGARVVADSLTGLALSGFDPVAYFTDKAPRLGEGRYELTYRGAVWRFQNVGNRDAFARDPNVYVPRFGGYDPVSLVRGVAVPGHPLIWLISSNRLYLFSTLEHRNSFAADIDRSMGAAEHHWPAVEATLGR